MGKPGPEVGPWRGVLEGVAPLAVLPATLRQGQVQLLHLLLAHNLAQGQREQPQVLDCTRVRAGRGTAERTM